MTFNKGFQYLMFYKVLAETQSCMRILTLVKHSSVSSPRVMGKSFKNVKQIDLKTEKEKKKERKRKKSSSSTFSMHWLYYFKLLWGCSNCALPYDRNTMTEDKTRFETSYENFYVPDICCLLDIPIFLPPAFQYLFSPCSPVFGNTDVSGSFIFLVIQ